MKRVIMVLGCLFMVISVQAQQTLTLEECRNLAIQNNKELQISSEKVRVAQYDRKAAFTKYFPELSASGTYMWKQKDLKLINYDNFGAVGELIPERVKDATTLDSDIWIGKISLVQPVFMGGKIVSYNQITEYSRQLAESMNEHQMEEVIYHTDETYWQVISLVNKKKLADTYTDLLRKTDRDITEMINEGIATQADGLSVKVKLNEAEMVQTQVDNALALSRMLLAQICGLPLEEPVSLADEKIDSIPLQFTEAKADVNEAFMNRQELKSLDLAAKIYKKKEALVMADMLPHVGVAVNYLATSPSAFNGISTDFKGMFTLGVNVKVPISGWWEGTHKRNSAKAETFIKRLEMEDAREKIELQVNQSVYKVNEAGKKLTASVRNMESAEENLRHANLGFDEGIIPALNLMEAQTAWVSARSNLIDSQIDVKLTEVYLTKALGKLSIEE